jgi:hypothetical protein
MTAYRITAPADGFTGDVAGVYFRDGVARVDDSDATVRAALAYCRRRGYTVAPVAKSAESEPAKSATAAAADRPKDYASKVEWLAYAIAQGADADLAAGMSKAELVDAYGKTSDEEGTST